MKKIVADSIYSDSNAFRVLGRHLLVELYACAPKLLNRTDLLKQALVEAANAAGATVVESVFHRFSPQGLSGVVVITESHITVHTWPEHAYAAVDIFTCGDFEKAEKIKNSLVERFAAKESRTKTIKRGIELPMIK